jgi:hypothetical protein
MNTTYKPNINVKNASIANNSLFLTKTNLVTFDDNEILAPNLNIGMCVETTLQY